MTKYENCPTSASSKRQPTMCSETPSAMTELTNRQVHRLRSVLKQNVEIHGRENFPTLQITLHQLILHVRRKIVEADMGLKQVKMNGGAASYVFCKSDDFTFSDIDLIFPVRLATEHDFEKIRVIILQCLLELMPESTRLMNPDILKDIYIRKMIKVTDQDRWSLFCLHNDYGKCIEFKFVDTMRRPFEFSVDSFQITLNTLLDNFYESHPVIQAESMYGDFHQALIHLNNRQIDTRNPEEIRGGGLLKYCFLLARGYHATPNCRGLEKYMCSRFFIDFSDINEQELKLHAFLENHFGGDCRTKSHYLHILFRVIRESTVCLMGHERRQTLSMVDRLKSELSYAVYCANQQRAEQSSQQENEMTYVPRQTLLYLPPNANQWIPVV
uniref:polynucleotide adenylyltransferase n=1 Tax=Ditylenchus dipsaci TaxID=166011 RepID=A0A915EK96_9BILA